MTRVISFKNIIQELVVSKHVLYGSLFSALYPVGHWLQDAQWIVMSFGAWGSQPITFLLFLMTSYYIPYLWLNGNPETTSLHYHFTFSSILFLRSIYLPSHNDRGPSTMYPLLRSAYRRSKEEGLVISLWEKHLVILNGKDLVSSEWGFFSCPPQFWQFFLEFWEKVFLSERISPLLLALEA